MDNNELTHLKDGEQDCYHDTEHQDAHGQDHNGFQARGSVMAQW